MLWKWGISIIILFCLTCTHFRLCWWWFVVVTPSACLVIRCTQIKTHAWSNACVLLVGNKCDIEESRCVSTKSAEELAKDLGNISLRCMQSQHASSAFQPCPHIHVSRELCNPPKPLPLLEYRMTAKRFPIAEDSFP